MISVICVYNNEDILNRYLINSLKTQEKKHELILLDNTKKRFKSASEALNYGGQKAKGKYLIFMHQDIDLLSDNWLKKAEEILNSMNKLGIAGVAGIKNRKGVISNISHGITPQLAGRFQIEKPTKVQTLDECLIIIPRSVFKIYQFDEDTCDNWHLYAVDYSLSIKSSGLEAYVIPLSLYHRSNALSLNKEYFYTLEKLLKKYKSSHNFIHTTMGTWSTLFSLKVQRTKLWKKFNSVLYLLSKNFRYKS